MMFSQLSNLQQRLVVSSIGVILLLTAIFFSHEPYFSPIFALLTAAVITTALWEYYTIAKIKGWLPLFKIGILGSILFTLAVYVRTQDNYKMLPESVIGLTFIAAFVYYFIKGSDPFVNLSITLFGFAYITIPLSCLIDINFFSDDPFVRDGRWVLLYLLLVTKMTDTGAFFVGKKYGRTQLSTYISPKKTWEGALGGLIASIATSVILYIIFNLFFTHPPFEITFFQSIWFGALISIVGQFGDLAESLLKRDVGVKDSSHLPGLGGMLDIVDSLVFTSPLMYIFLHINSNA